MKTQHIFCIRNMSDYSLLYDYLNQLWLEPKQSEIFVQTYLYGPKPASTIASLAHTERSYCYRVLEELMQRWLIQLTMIRWIKHYYIEDSHVLLNDLHKQSSNISKLVWEYSQIKSYLELLSAKKQPYAPKTTQYESIEGIWKRYDDMLYTIDSQWLLAIKCCITMNFYSQVTQFADLQKLAHRWIDSLTMRHIDVSGYLWSWVLVTESMSPLDLTTLSQISIGNQSVQLRIIWEYMYVWLFREMPFALKMRSPDLADLMQTMIQWMQWSKS